MSLVPCFTVPTSKLNKRKEGRQERKGREMRRERGGEEGREEVGGKGERKKTQLLKLALPKVRLKKHPSTSSLFPVCSR